MTPRDPGPGDAMTARLRHALGVAKRLRGEYREALRAQQQALDSIDAQATFDPTRMNVLTEIKLNLQELARPAEAAAFLDQALALSLRSQTRMNPDRADILIALGRRHN
jgi:tetratricopeptide (TPR) repeat protein